MSQQEHELPSNQKFGLFFGFVFAIACAYFLWKVNSTGSFAFGALSAVTLAVTAISPDKLLPLNKLWLQFGLLIGKIVSPIVLGLIFFVLITPVAIGMRLAGRDELRLKMAKRDSHWKDRTPTGPEPDSFKNQF